MKALIQHDVVRDRHLVYFYDRDDVTGVRWVHYDGRVIECVPGAEMPVALTLTNDQMEALVAAVTPRPGPSFDSVAFSAMDDARAVRDRLLALIEHTVRSGFGT